jgi:osmotically-inducible protein OsmY
MKQSGQLELRSLEFRIEGGIVSIGGTVRSYYLKQCAQEIARRVPGVSQVRNGVEVADC